MIIITNILIWILLWISLGMVGNILGFSLIDKQSMTWQDFKETYKIIFYGPFVILFLLFIVLFTEKDE